MSHLQSQFNENWKKAFESLPVPRLNQRRLKNKHEEEFQVWMPYKPVEEILMNFS